MSISKPNPTPFIVTLLATSTFIGTASLPANDDERRPDSYIEESIALLEKSFTARKQMILLEQQIENAVDDTMDTLETNLADAELDHEEAELKLELLTAGHDLSALLLELQEEGLEKYVSDVRKLFESHKKLAEASNQYFRTRRNKPDSEAEADLEETLESSFDSFEKQQTLLEMRIELFFTEEDGDTVLADELRKEISSIEG